MYLTNLKANIFAVSLGMKYTTGVIQNTGMDSSTLEYRYSGILTRISRKNKKVFKVIREIRVIESSMRVH